MRPSYLDLALRHASSCSLPGFESRIPIMNTRHSFNLLLDAFSRLSADHPIQGTIKERLECLSTHKFRFQTSSEGRTLTESFLFVEPIGIEPMTSGLQSRRSPS